MSERRREIIVPTGGGRPDRARQAAMLRRILRDGAAEEDRAALEALAAALEADEEDGILLRDPDGAVEGRIRALGTLLKSGLPGSPLFFVINN